MVLVQTALSPFAQDPADGEGAPPAGAGDLVDSSGMCSWIFEHNSAAPLAVLN